MHPCRKIAIIGSAHPLRGGIATYNERLAKAFVDNGDQVIIYSFKLQYPSILFPGKTQYSTEAKPAFASIETCINSINIFNWIRVGRRIKKLCPDVVIIKYWLPFMAPCLGTIARIIRSNKHTKIVSIVDNIIPHEKHFFDRCLSNYFVKSVHGFVAMSDSVLTDLETFNKQKPKSFCPHPLYDNFGSIISVGEAKANLQLDEYYRYILFFGFIRDYKGLDLLLYAMADERVKQLPVKLIVAGEFYTDQQPYLKIIKEKNISDRVVLRTDFIADHDVASYFCAADMVVQPYKTATQSGVTQIAYHFNKPMIVTDVGGLSEIVPNEKVGYVVKPSSEEVANAIFRFYKQQKMLEFSDNVKLEKTKYSWNRMIQTINELLLKI